jgi:hypothetical protein
VPFKTGLRARLLVWILLPAALSIPLYIHSCSFTFNAADSLGEAQAIRGLLSSENSVVLKFHIQLNSNKNFTFNLILAFARIEKEFWNELIIHRRFRESSLC